MSDYSLNAISPIDGRYQSKVSELSKYFSESALIRYRIRVEVEYFISLCKLPLPQLENVDESLYLELRKIYVDFSEQDAQRVKEIEKTTNHDVKAVEYFIKEKFDALGLQKDKEFIHFGLTSQDINNTAIPLSIKEAMNDVFVPTYFEVLKKLQELVIEWTDISMLARTHGQPASPTSLGKELNVFATRIEKELQTLKNQKM